jgi:hypothetical protein
LTYYQRISRVLIVGVALICIIRVTTLNAYEAPLKPASIHEAYVLGQRNDQATADFLNPYLKQFTDSGAQGPHIAEIEVLTPFAQVVDETRKRSASGYSEQNGAEDYRRRGDLLVLRILLMYPAAYPKSNQNGPETNPRAPVQQPAPSTLRPENFWQNFRFTLKQHGKTIPTKSMHNKGIYSAATKDAPSVLDGATVWLEYDAKDVASDLATVEVQTADAKTITATFDLQKLR